MASKYVIENPTQFESLALGIERGLIKAAKQDNKIVLILSDLGFPALDWFRENAPNNIVELGIAEANAVVVAAGLAAEGYKPFWYTFSFLIGRAYNQIRQCVAVDRFDVKMLLRGGYGGTGGISHNFIEDVAAMRVVPNMVIVDPADAVEAEKAMMAIADYIGPVFYKIEHYSTPLKIFKDDYPFELGKAVTVKEGGDAAIITCGYMLSESLFAAKLLDEEGIGVKIVNMSTLKPIDEEAIITAAKETGAIVTAENHSIIGGLGEAVATVLVENIPTVMARIGVRDEFSQSGVITPDGKDELKIHLGLTAQDIAGAVKETIKRRK